MQHQSAWGQSSQVVTQLGSVGSLSKQVAYPSEVLKDRNIQE